MNKNIILLLLLIFAFIANVNAYNFLSLEVKDIEVSNHSDLDKSFVIVTFESEPDFDGQHGTAGVGFYMNINTNNQWLSVFEVALSTGLKVDLDINTGTSTGDQVNPYKWHCTQCGTASKLNAVKLRRN